MDKPVNKPNVVISGFNDISAAKLLGNKPINNMLIDRGNYHIFLPLLHQVVTAFSSAGITKADS